MLKIEYSKLFKVFSIFDASKSEEAKYFKFLNWVSVQSIDIFVYKRE